MSWEYVTLDKLGNISRGRSKHRPRNDKVLFGGKYPFVQTADVKAAELYLTEYTETYNERGLEQSKLWKKGTLCITIAANIADTAILGMDACFPDSIMGFVPFEGVSNVKFVKYAFDILQRDCQKISQGTAQDNLSWKKLSTIKFPAPPIEIQDKIVGILSVYDDLIENNQKQIKLLEETAQRLYKEWFVDLCFPGHEDVAIVDGVPEGWKKQRISEFGDIITGKTPSTDKEQYYGGNIPFVKIPDMHGCVYPITTEVTLTTEGANTQRNKFIPKNGIMVSCIATVGLVNIAIEHCQTNQQINSIILNNEQDLYYVYSTMKRLKALLEGVGSNGATMTNVNKTKFGNLEVLYPTEDLCKSYFNFCEPIFKKIYSLSVSNNKLVQARDRLLPKLMSGEIEV
ncbi:MAG: restriction endonuclease subunit S [Lachnospiraceae bacterium]|nr:restriction endonuclease subunit S [Lachnospiraceae bacterium]